MSTESRYTLCRDYNGLFWDAILYVPTVTALAIFAFSSWYDDKTTIAYVLGFLACFFLFAGANRVLTTRLMLLPSAPVAIVAGTNVAQLILKNGEIVELRHDLKLYRDGSGKSFGLTGVTARGARRQFIFHRGQFRDNQEFQAVMNCYEPGRPGKA